MLLSASIFWIKATLFVSNPYFKLVMPIISGSWLYILASRIPRKSTSVYERSDVRIRYFNIVCALGFPLSTRHWKLARNYSSAASHLFSFMYIFPPHSLMIPMTLGSSMTEVNFCVRLKIYFILLFSLVSIHIWISSAKTSRRWFPLLTSKTSTSSKSSLCESAFLHAFFSSRTN